MHGMARSRQVMAHPMKTIIKCDLCLTETSTEVPIRISTFEAIDAEMVVVSPELMRSAIAVGLEPVDPFFGRGRDAQALGLTLKDLVVAWRQKWKEKTTDFTICKPCHASCLLAFQNRDRLEAEIAENISVVERAAKGWPSMSGGERSQCFKAIKRLKASELLAGTNPNATLRGRRDAAFSELRKLVQPAWWQVWLPRF